MSKSVLRWLRFSWSWLHFFIVTWLSLVLYSLLINQNVFSLKSMTHLHADRSWWPNGAGVVVLPLRRRSWVRFWIFFCDDHEWFPMSVCFSIFYWNWIEYDLWKTEFHVGIWSRSKNWSSASRTWENTKGFRTIYKNDLSYWFRSFLGSRKINIRASASSNKNEEKYHICWMGGF